MQTFTMADWDTTDMVSFRIRLENNGWETVEGQGHTYFLSQKNGRYCNTYMTTRGIQVELSVAQ